MLKNNDISNTKDLCEAKLKDNSEVRKFLDSEYKNIMHEQKQLMESVPLESLRIKNNELIMDVFDKRLNDIKENILPNKEVGLGREKEFENGKRSPIDNSDPYRIPDSEQPPLKSNRPLEEEITIRNKDLDGQKHPETGVPYERKIVRDDKGDPVEGVFPKFDSVFDVELPEDLLKASDKEQFNECNKQLKEAVEKDPELAKKFTPEQLEQIRNGETPDGYTWHHNEETGKMQLVDSETHAKSGHTGGKIIWGGGQENR